MGRKTYDSLPVILKNRKVVIISRNPNYLHNPPADHYVCDSFDGALELAGVIEEKEAFIIGGKSLYEESLKRDLLDKLYLTVFRNSLDLPATTVVTLPSYKQFLGDTPIDSKIAVEEIVNVIPLNEEIVIPVDFLTFNLRNHYEY